VEGRRLGSGELIGMSGGMPRRAVRPHPSRLAQIVSASTMLRRPFRLASKFASKFRAPLARRPAAGHPRGTDAPIRCVDANRAKRAKPYGSLQIGRRSGAWGFIDPHILAIHTGALHTGDIHTGDLHPVAGGATSKIAPKIAGMAPVTEMHMSLRQIFFRRFSVLSWPFLIKDERCELCRITSGEA